MTFNEWKRTKRFGIVSTLCLNKKKKEKKIEDWIEVKSEWNEDLFIYRVVLPFKYLQISWGILF